MIIVENNKTLPDTLLFLQDESPNGEVLIDRWYATNKSALDERIFFRQRGALGDAPSIPPATPASAEEEEEVMPV